MLIQIKSEEKNFGEKLDILKKIYNIKTNTKLVEHIIDLELQRFNIKIEESSENIKEAK